MQKKHDQFSIAEAMIAEHRYRQMLMAAESYKISMLTARDKYRRAVLDVDLFHNLTNGVMAAVQAENDPESMSGNGTVRRDRCRSKLLLPAHVLILHTHSCFNLL